MVQVPEAVKLTTPAVIEHTDAEPASTVIATDRPDDAVAVGV